MVEFRDDSRKHEKDALLTSRLCYIQYLQLKYPFFEIKQTLHHWSFVLLVLTLRKPHHHLIILSMEIKQAKIRKIHDYRSPNKHTHTNKKKKNERAIVHTFPNSTSDNTNPHASFSAFHIGEEITNSPSTPENKDMYSAQTMILPEIPLLNKKKKKEKFQSSRLLAFYFFLPRLLHPRKFHIQRS